MNKVKNGPQSSLSYTTLSSILIASGSIGLLSSFMLTLDKINISADSSYVPNCSLNPILSCVSVMQSPQSEILGFPNQVVGLMAFSSIITVGVLLLFTKQLPKRFWQLFIPSIWIGFMVIHWMIFQSLYVLSTLCLWCMATWVAFAPLAWYSLFYGLSHNYILNQKRFSATIKSLLQYRHFIVAIWYVAVIIAVTTRFWYYWKTLL